MKNFRFLWVLLSLCSCVAYISPGDLPALKGAWDGWYVYKSMHYRSVLMIHNDSVPLKGTLEIERGRGEAPMFYSFYNGGLDPHGHLVILFTDGTVLDLTLIREYTNLKLDGILYRGEISGRIALLKVQ